MDEKRSSRLVQVYIFLIYGKMKKKSLMASVTLTSNDHNVQHEICFLKDCKTGLSKAWLVKTLDIGNDHTVQPSPINTYNRPAVSMQISKQLFVDLGTRVTKTVNRCKACQTHKF
jgi:hypothetical protein